MDGRPQLGQLLTLAHQRRVTELHGIRASVELASLVQRLCHSLPAELDATLDAADQRALQDLAQRLLWGRRHDALSLLLDRIDALGAATPVSRAYRTLNDLTADGPEDLSEDGPGPATHANVRESARALLAEGDAALGEHRVVTAAAHLSAALWLLFHPELHDSHPASPLVSDPADWLAPLHDSRLGQLLTQPPRSSTATGHGPASIHAQGDTESLGSVTVLTGSYPRFAAPVVQALRESSAQVTELELSQVDKPFRRMAVEPWLVEVRLRAAMGGPISYPSVEQAVGEADSVLADWADAGAMLTSLLVPPGTRLTVRLHSVEALRAWVHLIDWSAVDHLVCVGPHIEKLTTAMLGPRLATTSTRVLPNIIDLGHFDHPRAADTDHTLAMVGWGRAVKDPLWAVELLARLRQQDGRWRLLLIGHPFEKVLPPGGRAYAARFARRVAEPDVRNAIEHIAFTPELPPVLARAGWVVSSSVRESWGVGPMEAVVAGAVPIIRNWPLLAQWGGARSLYPEEWVAETIDEAVSRVQTILDADRRQEEANQARAILTELVDPDAAALAYRDLLLGPDPCPRITDTGRT